MKIEAIIRRRYSRRYRFRTLPGNARLVIEPPKLRQARIFIAKDFLLEVTIRDRARFSLNRGGMSELRVDICKYFASNGA